MTVNGHKLECIQDRVKQAFSEMYKFNATLKSLHEQAGWLEDELGDIAYQLKDMLDG